MVDAVRRYLARRALLDRWPLDHDGLDGLWRVVVIPCLAELPGLTDTLDDLAECEPVTRDATLVVCVVNNRPPGASRDEDRRNNGETLAVLAERRTRGMLRLAVVDAASPGRELPEKDGVGLARKLGLDWGVAVLLENGRLDGPLISTDGDTRLDPGFLDAMAAFYDTPGRWAAVADYAHPLAGTAADAAIVDYELFLRCHELGLAWAGSPYGFPTIGSTISCTARACAAAGGMNRRQAAEDFYFLQQLAKTGRVDRVRTTVVRPAARASHRVPFGTGRSVQAYADDPAAGRLAYHPEGYRVLRDWLDAARAADDGLAARAGDIDARLADFLDAQGFVAAWERIRANSRPAQREARFHEWFDGFRTLKLLHHLRDHGLPRADVAANARVLLAMRGDPAPPPDAAGDTLDARRALLAHLRRLTTGPVADARRNAP